MRFFHFFLSHSFFIALCAVGLCLQTNILMGFAHNYILYALIFSCTLCSYNFYWLLSKFHFSNTRFNFIFLNNNKSYLVLFIISGILGSFFLFKSPHILNSFLVSIFLTIIYTMPLWPFGFSKYLQKLGFVKTLLLSITWAYVTTIIPFYSNDNQFYLNEKEPAILILFIIRFCFMFLLSILFDKRDIVIDKINGLQSIATKMSGQFLVFLLSSVYFFYTISTYYFCKYFSCYNHFIAFAITGIVFWFIYFLSLKKKGYVFYYFVVDGLMIFSALATFIASL
jgi:hypothetical protein